MHLNKVNVLHVHTVLLLAYLPNRSAGSYFLVVVVVVVVLVLLVLVLLPVDLFFSSSAAAIFKKGTLHCCLCWPREAGGAKPCTARSRSDSRRIILVWTWFFFYYLLFLCCNPKQKIFWIGIDLIWFILPRDDDEAKRSELFFVHQPDVVKSIVWIVLQISILNSWFH